MKKLTLTKLLIIICSFGLSLTGCSLLPSGPQNQQNNNNQNQQDNQDDTKYFTITWNNWDGSTIKVDEHVKEGTFAYYEGETPTRPDNERFSYSFNSWTPNLSYVHSDQVYTATYNEHARSYTITWCDYDGTVLQTSSSPYGSIPRYFGTPYRPSDGVYEYTFAGWSPTVVSVTKDATYYATYTATPIQQTQRAYRIEWKDWDSTILRVDSVPEGEMPMYGGYPTRPSDDHYTYEFSGWYPAVTSAYQDRTYTAQYEATLIQPQSPSCIITWRNWDGTVLYTEYNVPEGVTPTYTGQTPSRPSDGVYSYVFAGWNPEVAPVYVDTIYTAQFNAIPIEQPAVYYSITWVNWDGTPLITAQQVLEGTLPAYSGPTPIRPSDEDYYYEFSGWFPEVVAAYSDAVYTAQYNASILHKHTYSLDWSYNADYHWHSATCGHDVMDSWGLHSFGDWIEDDEATFFSNGKRHRECSVCGYYQYEDTYKNDERFYYYQDGGYFISGLKEEYQDLVDVVLPKYYNGQPIIGIGNYAFRENHNIKSVTIPASVRTIGEQAFEQCFNLEHCVIPKNSQLVNIGKYAFQFCIHLKEIYIPNAITSIGEQTFYYCWSLSETNLSRKSQIRSIGEYAFFDCISLHTITLPSCLTSIGNEAFNRCKKLCEIINYSDFNIEAGSTTCGNIAENAKRVVNKPSYSITDEIEINHLDDQNSNGYKDLGYFDASDLTAVRIGLASSTESTIESLRLVSNSGVQRWFKSNDVFGMDGNTITDQSVGKIFSAYLDIDLVATGISGIIHIYSDADTDISLTQLYKLHDKDFRSAVNTNANGFVTYKDEQDTYLIDYVGDSEIVNVPTGVTRIGSYAFYGYSSMLNSDYMMLHPHVKLREVIIPEGVTTIDENAISECNCLYRVILPSTLVTMSSGSINASNLCEIINPSGLGLGYMGAHVISDANDTLIMNDNGFIIYDGNQCVGYTGSEANITIPSYVTYIRPYAFAYNKSLVNIIIPDNVTELRYRAFSCCTNIRTVTLSNSLTEIDDTTFEFCENLEYIDIPDSVTRIGICAFQNCASLTAVNFTENTQLQRLDGGAFDMCDKIESLYFGKEVNEIQSLNNLHGLKNIVVDKENENYTSIDGVLFDKNVTTLLRCPVAKEFDFATIPQSVNTIGQHAFYHVSAETVVIGDNIKVLDDYALFGLDSTRNYVLPTSLERIGTWNFTSKGEDTTFTYLGTVTQWKEIDIDEHAFVSCRVTVHCIDGDVQYYV